MNNSNKKMVLSIQEGELQRFWKAKGLSEIFLFGNYINLNLKLHVNLALSNLWEGLCCLQKDKEKQLFQCML